MKSAILAALLLCACSTTQLASNSTKVDSALAKAQSNLAEAAYYWNVSKASLLTVAAAKPDLAPKINLVVAKGDAVVAQAAAASSNATTDSATLEAMAMQINSAVLQAKATISAK